MLKQKDSLLTFSIRLTSKPLLKDCLLIYRPINKSVSIVTLLLSLSSNQRLAKFSITNRKFNYSTKILSLKSSL